jgi:hypothetical protein
MKLYLSLNNMNRLRLFENRVLKGILKSKGEKAYGNGAKCTVRSFTKYIRCKILLAWSNQRV